MAQKLKDIFHVARRNFASRKNTDIAEFFIVALLASITMVVYARLAAEHRHGEATADIVPVHAHEQSARR
jgi:hypothetical protein